MKNVSINKDNRDFAAIFYLGNRSHIGRIKYVLTNRYEYEIPTVFLNSIIIENYIKKRNMNLNKNQSIDIEFSGNNCFDSILYTWKNEQGMGKIIEEDCSVNDYFDLYHTFETTPVVLLGEKLSAHCLRFDKFQLNPTESEDSIEVNPKKVESIYVKTSEKGLKYFDCDKELELEEAVNFFCHSFCEHNIKKYFQEISFNCHANRLGIADIYEQIKDGFDYSSTKILNLKSIERLIMAYTEISTADFYSLAESYIKLGIDFESAINKISVITGKPLPIAKDVLKISTRSLEAIKDVNQRRFDELVDLLSSMEQNPKIGVNNVHLLLDFMDCLDKIKYPNGKYFATHLPLYFTFNDFENINKILERFECNPKILIDKSIRAIFYYNLSPSDYFQMIVDYHKMCDMLNIKVEKKIPGNVVSLHDKLCLIVKELEDKKIQQAFQVQTSQNKKLILDTPKSSKYIIIAPNKLNDLIEEGRYLNHCVGSYQRQVANGSSKIFFVREKENPDLPYVTIELNKNNLLVQAKGFSNCNPKKDVMDYVHQWLNVIGGRYEQ